tara:strand:+ start:2184 stop:3110 length:927 start_codon:yes stop_codon:yes gene_type:complete
MFNIKFLLTIILTFFFNLNVYSLENKILLKIDNEIITSVDIFLEIQYLTAINKNIVKLKNEKIFEIAKNSLIRRKVKEKEIKKYSDNFEINPSYIDKVINTNASNLGFNSLKEFKSHLNSFGLNTENLKSRILNEILWNELVVNKYGSKLVINEKKIKNQIETSNKESKSYLLSEIIFDLPRGSKIEEKYKSIQQEISKNGFENASLIYSISDTSSTGGKLGWIKEVSLNSLIKDKISNTNKGQYTKPIQIPGGFLILKVNDIKVNIEKLDKVKELEKRVREQKNQQLNQYSLIYFNKVKKDTKINEL